MGNQLALQWSETGREANIAFLSRPFDTPASIYNTAALVDADEAYSAANIADYRIAPAEQGASGRYLATLPAATPEGYREIVVCEMAGAALAESDLLSVIGFGLVYWDGTDVLPADEAGGGGGLTAEQIIAAVWTDAGSRTLTGVVAGVTVVGPVLSADRIVLVRGDDYLAADGRALLFTFSGVPSLVGATIVFSIAGYISSSAGEALDATNVQIELTRAQTIELTPRTGKGYAYDIQATLASGSVITLARGECFVLADVSS